MDNKITFCYFPKNHYMCCCFVLASFVYRLSVSSRIPQLPLKYSKTTVRYCINNLFHFLLPYIRKSGPWDHVLDPFGLHVWSPGTPLSNKCFAMFVPVENHWNSNLTKQLKESKTAPWTRSSGIWDKLVNLSLPVATFFRQLAKVSQAPETM